MTYAMKWEKCRSMKVSIFLIGGSQLGPETSIRNDSEADCTWGEMPKISARTCLWDSMKSLLK